MSGVYGLTCPTCKVAGDLDADKRGEAHCTRCGADWVYEDGTLYRAGDLRLARNIEYRLRAAEEALRDIRSDSIGVHETFAWRARIHINAYFERVGEKADP